MRILQVTAAYYPELQFGGPPYKIHVLSRRLSERGYVVQVTTFKSTQPMAFHQVTIDGVQVQYVPWVGQGNWKFALDYGRLWAAVRWADVVHCYGLYNVLCPAAAWFARQARRPLILEPLGMYVPRLGHVGAKKLYHRFLTSWMSRQAAKVIATSPAEASDLAQLVGDDRLVLRRNVLDLAAFENLPDRNAFRAEHGLDQGERVILFIGRISPVKNLEQLVLAFHQAALERARLMLVGPMLEPDYAARLRALIANLNLADRVSFVGPLYGPDKLAALAAADLFVLPSVSESFGNAAAEAVAAGVPVLLTETCGIAPLIHGRAGWAVPQTTTALREGLRVMLDQPDERARLMQRRAQVLDELSEEEPLKQAELLYEQVTRDFRQIPP